MFHNKKQVELEGIQDPIKIKEGHMEKKSNKKKKDLSVTFQELETSINTLLEESDSQLYITNLDQSLWSIKTCYCLILEKSKIELIERSPLQKQHIEFNIKTKKIFKNGKKQNPILIGEFSKRVYQVIQDLQQEKASIYENE